MDIQRPNSCCNGTVSPSDRPVTWHLSVWGICHNSDSLEVQFCSQHEDKNNFKITLQRPAVAQQYYKSPFIHKSICCVAAHNTWTVLHIISHANALMTVVAIAHLLQARTCVCSAIGIQLAMPDARVPRDDQMTEVFEALQLTGLYARCALPASGLGSWQAWVPK